MLDLTYVNLSFGCMPQYSTLSNTKRVLATIAIVKTLVKKQKQKKQSKIKQINWNSKWLALFKDILHFAFNANTQSIFSFFCTNIKFYFGDFALQAKRRTIAYIYTYQHLPHHVCSFGCPQSTKPFLTDRCLSSFARPYTATNCYTCVLYVYMHVSSN